MLKVRSVCRPAHGVGGLGVASPPPPPTLRWGSPVSGAPSCACRGPGAPHCPCARALFLPVLGSPVGALCLPPGGRGQGHRGRSRTRRGGQQPGRRSWPVDAPLQTGAGAQVRAGLGRLAAGRGAVCRAPRTEWRLEPRAHLVRGGDYTQGAQHWSGQRVPRPPGFVSLGLLGVWRVFLKKDTRVPHPATGGLRFRPRRRGARRELPGSLKVLGPNSSVTVTRILSGVWATAPWGQADEIWRSDCCPGLGALGFPKSWSQEPSRPGAGGREGAGAPAGR